MDRSNEGEVGDKVCSRCVVRKGRDEYGCAWVNVSFVVDSRLFTGNGSLLDSLRPWFLACPSGFGRGRWV